MEADLHNRIRRRAYEIWFAAGCRDGEAQQHWLAAEREILEAARPGIRASGTSAKKVRRPPASATPKAATG